MYHKIYNLNYNNIFTDSLMFAYSYYHFNFNYRLQ